MNRYLTEGEVSGLDKSSCARWYFSACLPLFKSNGLSLPSPTPPFHLLLLVAPRPIAQCGAKCLRVWHVWDGAFSQALDGALVLFPQPSCIKSNLALAPLSVHCKQILCGWIPLLRHHLLLPSLGYSTLHGKMLPIWASTRH